MVAAVLIAALGIYPASTDTLETPFVQETALEEVSDADNADAAALQEELHDLASWKIDLNEADAEALQILPGISKVDVQRILQYRRETGRFRSLSDLRSAGLSPEVVDRMAPYVEIARRPGKRYQLEIIQRWSRRIDRGRGYRPDSAGTKYAGRADALYTRLRIKKGSKLSLGLTFEKDAGEPFRWAPSARAFGFDFAATHAAVSDVGPFKDVLLGDYRLSAGEGLILGQGLSTMSRSAVRSRKMLRPHTSSREFGYFRGIALRTQTWRGFDVAAFYSRRRVDARFDSVNGDWSFASSGLHRTATERAARARILEQSRGATLSFRQPLWNAGILASRTSKHLPENREMQSDLSAFFSLASGNVAISAEAAFRGPVPGLSAMLTYEPVPTTRIWLSGFGTMEGAAAPHTVAGASSRGESRRETVVDGGVVFQPFRAWTVRVASHRRRAPSHPIVGATSDSKWSLEYQVASWLRVHLRAREKRTARAASCPAAAGQLRCSEVEHKREFRLQADYEHSRSFRARFRIARSFASTGAQESDGILVFEDFRLRPLTFVQLDARILFFDVADFPARLSAYENDVLYAFSSPSFTGRGRRVYFLLRVDVLPQCSIQVKFASTNFEDVRTVGSGLDETTGSKRREFRIQFRWRFM